MDKELLKILVCPVTKGPLVFDKEKNELISKSAKLAYPIKNKFSIIKKETSLDIEEFDVTHGMIKATGFVLDKIAYLSDCNKISNNSLKKLKNLNYLIIDCLKKDKHPSHFNYNDAIELIKILKPKTSILTNLHVDLDYFKLKKKLPRNIIPAYDGLSFNF